MSDHDPGVDRYALYPPFPDGWPHETEASVFRRPSQHLRDVGARPSASDHAGPATHQFPAQPGNGAWSAPPTQPVPPTQPAYSPARSANPPPSGFPPTQPYASPYSSQAGYPPGSDRSRSAYAGRSPYESDAYSGRSGYSSDAYSGRSIAPGDGRRAFGRGGAQADGLSRDRREGRRGFPLGFGAFVGVAGLTCLLLALIVLPWFRAAGQDVTRSDLEAALALPQADADDLVPDASDVVPEDLSEGVPTPGEVGDAVEEQARDAAGEAATAAIDEGRRRYLELYTDVGWMAVAGGAAAAVLFSTILTPRSRLLSLLLGLRVIAGLGVVAAGVAHGVALWVVFGRDDAPEPAVGVWLGAGGLAAVLLSCLIGPKR